MRITTCACIMILQTHAFCNKIQAKDQKKTTTSIQAHAPVARQGKARQGKARQGKARQGKARQGIPIYALVLAWVLSAGGITCMLFAWVYKRDLLKPMRITTCARIMILQTHAFCSKILAESRHKKSIKAIKANAPVHNKSPPRGEHTHVDHSSQEAQR